MCAVSFGWKTCAHWWLKSQLIFNSLSIIYCETLAGLTLCFSLLLCVDQGRTASQRDRCLSAERVWWRCRGQNDQRQNQGKFKLRWIKLTWNMLVLAYYLFLCGKKNYIQTLTRIKKWIRVCSGPNQEMIPFAVVGSDQEYQVNGKRLLGRKTKWGTIEGNRTRVLLGTHMIFYLLTSCRICI